MAITAPRILAASVLLTTERNRSKQGGLNYNQGVLLPVTMHSGFNPQIVIILQVGWRVNKKCLKVKLTPRLKALLPLNWGYFTKKV